MKLKSYFSLSVTILCFLSFNSFAQIIEWQKTLGGTGNDEPTTIIGTGDKGFIVVGHTNSTDGDLSGLHPSDYDDYWITKFDSIGEIDWQKIIVAGQSGAESFPTSIINSHDGNYIFSTITPELSETELIKIDNNGELLWRISLEDSGITYINSVISTHDSGYAVAGTLGASDLAVVKLDSSLNVQWSKTFGGSPWDVAKSIIQTHDLGYILAGTTENNGNDSRDFWIVKLDSSGNLDWQKTMGGQGNDEAYSIIQTSGQGYIVAGSTESSDGDVSGFHQGEGSDFWVVKIDSMGNILWEKALGGYSTDKFSEMIITKDGGVILTGSSQNHDTNGDISEIAEAFDFWTVKLDSLGNIQWEKLLGESHEGIIDEEQANAIIETDIFEYVVVGYTEKNYSTKDYLIAGIKAKIPPLEFSVSSGIYSISQYIVIKSIIGKFRAFRTPIPGDSGQTLFSPFHFSLI